MIDALTRPRWLWVSIFLGVYSALIALARTPVFAIALLDNQISSLDVAVIGEAGTQRLQEQRRTRCRAADQPTDAKYL